MWSGRGEVKRQKGGNTRQSEKGRVKSPVLEQKFVVPPWKDVRGRRGGGGICVCLLTVEVSYLLVHSLRLYWW